MARGRRLKKSGGGDLEVDKKMLLHQIKQLLSKMLLHQIRKLLSKMLLHHIKSC
jgi:hypothetical protein